MKLPNWRKAYPLIPWQAQYKTTHQDFWVKEILSFELDRENGVNSHQVEHLYLFIEKNSLTSYQLVDLLVGYFDVEHSCIGYAGLKDKNAITQQWFSIYLPGKYKSLDIEMLLGSQLVTTANLDRYQGQCRILNARWHSGKLRRGAIAKNKFSIRLRSESKIPQAVIGRLQLIQSEGFPNYFGKQRFGIEAQNLNLIEEWIQHQNTPESKLKSLLFSAARSYLFNHILESRIVADNWHTVIAGDYLMLNGSRTGFKQDALDSNLLQRCEQGDIHPCASLKGEGQSMIVADAANFESKIFSQFDSWCQLLAQHKLQYSYRAMRCLVQDLSWQLIKDTDLQLDFALPSGSYATTFLNELGEIIEAKPK